MALQKKVAASGNLAEGLRIVAELYRDNTAQLFRDENGELNGRRTFGEFYAAVSSIATGLLQQGFPPGGRAGIYASTCPEWNIADMAVLSCGGTTIGIYTNDNIDNIEHKLLDSKVVVLFVDNEERLNRILGFPSNSLPDLSLIVSFSNPSADITDDRFVSFQSLIDTEPDRDRIAGRISDITPETLARIVYTAGTDGKPKGAMLSHKNLLSNMTVCSDLLDFQPDDICFSYLPAAHIFQTMVSNMTIFNGCSLSYSGKETFSEDLAAAKATIFPGVPKVFYNFIKLLEKEYESVTGKKTDFSSDDFSLDPIPDILKKMGLDRLRICLSGAAKLDVNISAHIDSKLGIPVLEGYGLSETSPVIAVNTLKDKKIGTVGKVIPGLDVIIVSEEGYPVPPGTPGEISVRGDSVFSGYLNLPELSSSVFSRDGYFYTGDIGIFDHDNFLQVHGRKGNQVKFANGEYYNLEQIGERFHEETVLIQQVAVVGEQKDYPVAVISFSEELDFAVRYADSIGIPYDNPYDLVYNDKMIEAVKEEFLKIKASQQNMHPMERVEKVLYVRPFSPRNKEATTTGRVRIKRIFKKYKAEIEKLYNDDVDFRVLKIEKHDIES